MMQDMWRIREGKLRGVWGWPQRDLGEQSITASGDWTSVQCQPLAVSEEFTPQALGKGGDTIHIPL